MSEPADVVIIQQPPAAKVVIAAEGVSPTGGGVTEVSAADATITVAGTPDHPTLKVTSGTFDAAGAAATAQSTAETFATAAVATEATARASADTTLATAVIAETTRAEAAEASLATSSALTAETSRAETAEALALPKTGGTMSGAIAMGAHKVTGLTNGSASDDAAAFGQIPAALPPNGSAGGDLSGTFPSPTVAKIQSVAISAAIATLLSQLNGAGTLAASGTLVAGAWTELTGTTASQTATLPASTAQASSVNVIQNNSTQVWTIAPGASTTLLYNTTSGGFLLAPNCSITVVLIGTVWVVMAYSGIGQQTAGTPITANWATQLAGTSAWQQAATGTGSSGTAPSITLPNDNRIYSVECIGSLWKVGTANDIVGLGLGTSTSVILASAVAALSATGAALPPIVAQAVTGTGQTINMYAQNATGNGASHILTVQAAASGAANLTSPSVITATRVG